MSDEFDVPEEEDATNRTIEDLRNQIKALEGDLKSVKKDRESFEARVKSFEEEKRAALLADLPEELRPLVQDKAVDELPGVIQTLKTHLGAKPEPQPEPEQSVPTAPTGTPPGSVRMSIAEFLDRERNQKGSGLADLEAGRVELPLLEEQRARARRLGQPI